jgi:hypothetical protein
MPGSCNERRRSRKSSFIRRAARTLWNLPSRRGSLLPLELLAAALGQAGRWGVTTYLGSRADWKPALYTVQPEPVLAAQLPQHRPERAPLRHHRTASSPVH